LEIINLIKFQYADEVSNETYLGLSQTDFEANPFNRYASSQDDKMTNDHIQFTVSHEIEFSKQFRITTDAYHNGFSRNWYKLNDVTFNGDRVGISSVLNNPENYPYHFSIVNGSSNSESDALRLKANNRVYKSQGVQTKLDYHWSKNNIFHDLEIGFRTYLVEKITLISLYLASDLTINLILQPPFMVVFTKGFLLQEIRLDKNLKKVLIMK